ncbi:MAG TPA: phospholipase D-like domain-containing protein [Kiritimatiellia bacterium]|nr:phospholipase D-like domain-containing protein [Kiritimatiellia bacterium]HRU69584.1 phospholipase D-like domain-containing protein [Kiritimatiellia bacterium]
MKQACVFRTVFSFLLLGHAAGCCWHAVKPLPDGLSHQSAWLPCDDARFLCDLTGLDANGVRQSEQQIFDEVFAMINRAERIVVIDMFLFNAFLGTGSAHHRPLCGELTQALIHRKRAVPGLRALVITDPVNTVYGGLKAAHVERLETAGVDVVFTRLERLRDSNVAWSSLWRLLAQPWGNSPRGGWVSNPFGGEPVTVRSWLALLNFKANHRKVVIADDGSGLRALVTSANPHDGSSAHTNVALAFGGPAARDLLRTEEAVLAFSGPSSQSRSSIVGNDLQAPSADACRTRIQILTEAQIGAAAVAMIDATQAGDALDLVMFYLADRPIIRALKRAARRGVSLHVLLDPNKDAFGRTKNGMPNRQVARELAAAGVPVRWAATHGEQMHAKLLLIRHATGTGELLLGSANFTRRNVRDFNLETNVRLSGILDAPAIQDAADFADRLWSNADNRVFSLDYEAFRDDSRRRVWLYRLQEATGLCTW